MRDWAFVNLYLLLFDNMSNVNLKHIEIMNYIKMVWSRSNKGYENDESQISRSFS